MTHAPVATRCCIRSSRKLASSVTAKLKNCQPTHSRGVQAREQQERDRDAAELAAVMAAQTAAAERERAREAAAAAERRALSDAIRKYNECANLVCTGLSVSRRRT